MENKKPTNPVKVIRAFCAHCMGGNVLEVSKCTAPNCPLFDWRFGKNPYRKKVELSDEQREKIARRFERVRRLKPKTNATMEAQNES